MLSAVAITSPLHSSPELRQIMASPRLYDPLRHPPRKKRVRQAVQVVRVPGRWQPHSELSRALQVARQPWYFHARLSLAPSFLLSAPAPRAGLATGPELSRYKAFPAQFRHSQAFTSSRGQGVAWLVDLSLALQVWALSLHSPCPESQACP